MGVALTWNDDLCEVMIISVRRRSEEGYLSHDQDTQQGREDFFLVRLDWQRADAAGQRITPVPGLSSTTAAGPARRVAAGSGCR